MQFILSFLLSAFFPFSFACLAHANEAIREFYEQAANAYNSGDYEKAVEFYTKVTETAPGFAPGYTGLAMALKGLNGDTEEAMGHIRTAIALDPKYVPAYETAGRFYYEDQEFDRGQEYFEKALSIDPQSVNAKLNLAWIYLMAKGRPAKAIAYFKQAQASSSSPSIIYGLGLAYFADNQRAKALEIITQLRKGGQEDYATRLETAVRENRKVNIQPVAPQTSKPKTSNPAVTTPSPNATTATEATTPKGVKVRLRGKLSDI